MVEATGGVIEMIEAKLSERLLRTSLTSGARHSTSSGVLATAFGLLSGGSGQPNRVIAEDPDGSPARGDYFTVMNTIPHATHRYVGMQVSHVHWFSTVRKWLVSMYGDGGGDGGRNGGEKKKEQQGGRAGRRRKRRNMPQETKEKRKIPEETTVAVLKYCLRVRRFLLCVFYLL